MQSTEKPKFVDLVPPTSALIKVVERHPSDPSLLNLLGLLSEQQGLFNQASQAFSRALVILEKSPSLLKESAAARANLGRVLCAQGHFQDAITCLSELSSPDVDSKLGLGIALFFDRQLEKSMKEFEQALTLITDTSDLRTQAVLLICQVRGSHCWCL